MTQEQLLACLDADSHRLCRDAMPHVPDAPGLAAAEIRRLQAELDELRAPHTSHVTIPERFYVEMKSNNTV